jgi:hypothetical protein
MKIKSIIVDDEKHGRENFNSKLSEIHSATCIRPLCSILKTNKQLTK